LSPLDDCPSDASPGIAKAYTERSIYQSCHALNLSRLDLLMLHRASHLTAWHGAVWRTACELKSQGLIGELGVSVQSPEEALRALDYEGVGFIQLPFNILDYRWEMVIEKISRVRCDRSLVVHARSALLQGLLTTDQEELWQRARCTVTSQVIGWLKRHADRFTGGDVIELCLRFVLSQKWIDGVVIGVDTKDQLVDNLTAVSAEGWHTEQLNAITEDRPRVAEETLDPSAWRKIND
jgi:spore coat polysaccharide biosynthesis protein SpsF